MSDEDAMELESRLMLLRRMLVSWFGREGGSVPAVPISNDPSAADVARAHELIRKHGWHHLLVSK